MWYAEGKPGWEGKTSMRKTSLVFVEGIMGAGKTTTAWFLTQELQRQGLAARFLFEGPTVEDPDYPLGVATELPHPNGVWLDVTIQQYIEPLVCPTNQPTFGRRTYSR